MKHVIGIDYGTQSARAVLMNAQTGEVVCSHRVNYAHGEGADCLVPPMDYDNALEELLEAVTLPAYREDIVSICVDATSLTLVPVGADGRALGYSFPEEPHAQIKLWKRHTAQRQTAEALILAKRRREPFLGRTGGSISGEWMLPKLMETYDEAPALFNSTDIAFDLCEYLTWRLTGNLVRSTGSMCYKSLWAQDLGLPSREYLNELRPGLGEKYHHLLRGTVLRPGDVAGTLHTDWCTRLGLSQDVTVAAGVLDGHTMLVALGALQPGDAALVVGTSNVLTIQTEELHEMDGVCGIAKDGLTPGLYGIDSGQACTGDMLGWFVKNGIPAQYEREAEERGVSIHTLLSEKTQEPWNNPVIACDWWNGSRNTPCDLTLSGSITGLSLQTKPEDIYLALLQAIVCGTGAILDQCAQCGVKVNRLVIGGGVAQKNPLLMEQYANLLGMPVLVARAEEGPAIGAGIFAAVAAGIYPSVQEAYQHLGVKEFQEIFPDQEHAAPYRERYNANKRFRKQVSG